MSALSGARHPGDTMDEPVEAQPAKEKKKRKYTLTRKALAARRANIKKAHQAPKEKIYRSTEKRDTASMANLEKAIAGRKSPEGNERCRMNALKHGFSARDMKTSVARLGEDPKAYEEHLAQFHRLVAPSWKEEEELVAALAEACWRRLRLYPAQASWERLQLDQVFTECLGFEDWHAPLDNLKLEPGNSRPDSGHSPVTVQNSELPAPPSTGHRRPSILAPQATWQRAYCMPDALLHRDHLEDQMHRIWAQIVRLLTDLVERRSEYKIHFQPPPPPHMAAYDKEVARVVEAAIERHNSAAANGGDCGLTRDDGKAGEVETGNSKSETRGARAETGDASLETANSETKTGAAELEAGKPRTETAGAASSIGHRESSIRQSLEAVFLPVDRKERTILRRIATLTEYCFTRYAEEAQRDAERLRTFLAAATGRIDDCRLSIDDCQDENRNSKIETREDETRDSQPETASDGRVSNFDFRVSSSEQSAIGNRQSSIPSGEQLLALAQSLVDVLFPRTSLRDELDQIDVGIGVWLNELVRKRSGGTLWIQINNPKGNLDSLAKLLDRTLADAPPSHRDAEKKEEASPEGQDDNRGNNSG